MGTHAQLRIMSLVSKGIEITRLAWKTNCTYTMLWLRSLWLELVICIYTSQAPDIVLMERFANPDYDHLSFSCYSPAALVTKRQ